MTVVMDTKLEQVGELLTLREASNQLGTTRNALYQWMRRNGIECKAIGRTLLIRKVDLVAYSPRGK